MIKGAHIVFRPGKTLEDLMKVLNFQQVLTRDVAQTGDTAHRFRGFSCWGYHYYPSFRKYFGV